MITREFLTRVFRLNCGDKRGTCFTLEVNGRQYVITARHLVESADTIDDIRISHREFGHTPVQLVGHAEGSADISVLACDCQISNATGASFGDGYSLSQDAYFLGFPYGLEIDVSQEVAPLSALPLVKKGIISGFEEGHLIYLDGHNNPGFSGGPVVCVGNDGSRSIEGVVRGFLRGSGADSGNSGIAVAYGIQHALDVIGQNPIGYELN